LEAWAENEAFIRSILMNESGCAAEATGAGLLWWCTKHRIEDIEIRSLRLILMLFDWYLDIGVRMSSG
jgi:hypothetical protein